MSEIISKGATSYPGWSLSLCFSPLLSRLPWYRAGGVVFDGEFDFIAMTFRMAGQGMVSSYRHKHFVDMKILYLQQDVGKNP